ncbi:MAG: hypothetical protein ABIE55_00895 [Candidatus Aenigmatarchaeota archaeon]
MKSEYSSLEEAMKQSYCPAFHIDGACVGLSYCPNGKSIMYNCSCDVIVQFCKVKP